MTGPPRHRAGSVFGRLPNPPEFRAMSADFEDARSPVGEASHRERRSAMGGLLRTPGIRFRARSPRTREIS